MPVLPRVSSDCRLSSTSMLVLYISKELFVVLMGLAMATKNPVGLTKIEISSHFFAFFTDFVAPFLDW